MPADLFELGFGLPVSIRQVASLILEKINSGSLNFDAKSLRDGESFVSVADISAFQKSYNWTPVYNLDLGLDLTIQTISNSL